MRRVTGAKRPDLLTRIQRWGQKPAIRTREEQCEGRRGQKSRICSRESNDGGRNPRSAPVRSNAKDDGGKKAGFAHVNQTTGAETRDLHMSLDVTVLHRQPGSHGGTHSALLRSALLPSPASSLTRELVSGRHLPLPEAVGWPRPPWLPDCRD